MLSPNRTKFRKVHKGRIRGMAKGGSDITFGDFGLQAICQWSGNRAPNRGCAYCDDTTRKACG